MSDLCMTDEAVFSKSFAKKMEQEDRQLFGMRILLSAVCLLLWLVPVIGVYVFPSWIMKYKLCFWIAFVLFVGLGIDQVRMIKKIQLELQKLYSENEELAASLRIMKHQVPSLEHLMQVRHDVRAQYNAVMGLAQLGMYEKIKSYLASIYDDLASVDDFPPGISPVLSIVIGEIRKETRKSGIDFEYHVTSQDLGLQAKDVTCLYFNMLNNAVEAAKVSGVEKSYIELEIKREENMVYVRCINSADIVKLRKCGEQYETIKSDEEHHGLGMEIMRNTLKTYHGKMETDARDDCFIVTAKYECRKVLP